MCVWPGLVNTPPVNGRVSRVRAAPDPRCRCRCRPARGLAIATTPPIGLASPLPVSPRRRFDRGRASSPHLSLVVPPPRLAQPRPRGPPEPPRRRRCLAFARGLVVHTPRAAAGPQVALSVATSPPRRAPPRTTRRPQVAHRGCAPLHS